MEATQTQIRFNETLYKEYRRKAGKRQRDGLFDITTFPNGLYCFPLRKELGINGKLDKHELYGTRWLNKTTGKSYLVDSVNVHWWRGYYYFITLERDGSHTTAMPENINSTDLIIINAIESFKENWKQIK